MADIEKVLTIMDLVCQTLESLYKIASNRRDAIKKIEAQGGVITAEDWAASDKEFQEATDRLLVLLAGPGDEEEPPDDPSVSP